MVLALHSLELSSAKDRITTGQRFELVQALNLAWHAAPRQLPGVDACAMNRGFKAAIDLAIAWSEMGFYELDWAPGKIASATKRARVLANQVHNLALEDELGRRPPQDDFHATGVIFKDVRMAVRPAWAKARS
ncbi:hypothetical protein [uncultured Alsobacter sp.]|uniref:hypothetical protein n=1 Tax=uncultured Alsobacter sp. TaxID=1748258 RepID=UPI0025E8F348|nr:hypothetical protein [uncultured Alsobacter sp.]